MQLLVKPDFFVLIDETTLEVLTGGDDLLLDMTEGRAIQEMNGYLNSRFDVLKIFDPSLTRNSLVVMYLCDIVLYHLHSRVMPDNIPELRVKRYDEAKEWLEKCADGYTNPLLPAKVEADKMPLRFGTSSPKQNPYF